MRVRSVSDMGAEHESWWFGILDRSSMVHALLPTGTTYVDTNSEDRCWWDQVRLNIGPPFQPGFKSRFIAEHKMIKKSRSNS